MKKRTFIIITLVTLALVALFTLNVFAVTAKEYSWYCVRKKDHLQPRCDANVAFIEDLGGYYVDKRHGDS